jgi:hypothetical protein
VSVLGEAYDESVRPVPTRRNTESSA